MPGALVVSCCLGVTMGERGGDVDKGLPEISYFTKGRSFTELSEVEACGPGTSVTDDWMYRDGELVVPIWLRSSFGAIGRGIEGWI